MNIDTLSIARDLKATELPVSQAEAIAAAIGRAVTEGSATAADLALLRSDLHQIEARIEGKIEAMHAKLLTWFIGAQIAVGGIIIAFIKL